MNVALLADPLYNPLQSGITRYTLELVQQLNLLPEVTLELFSLLKPEQIAEAVHQVEALGHRDVFVHPHGTVSPITRPIQYLLWHLTGYVGPVAEALRDADIVHTPCLYVPPRRKRPLVVTVHDLSCSLFPQHHTWKNQMITRSGLHRAAREADALITDAECTADDLVRLEGVPRKKIYVVPLAADERFLPTHNRAVLERYGIDGPYVLYVGTLEPRKNLPLLLEAFAALDHARLFNQIGAPVKLVIAGGKGWLYDSIFKRIKELGIQERVIFTGFVADADLPALYSDAQVFVYPSLFEGFGLPVLEAMCCGAPVITSTASSLPEVAGDAALLVSPDDVAGMGKQMQRVLMEPGLQADLRGKGLERACLFSWEKTARLTADVYRQVLQAA